jgi:hypothetical protein
MGRGGAPALGRPMSLSRRGQYLKSSESLARITAKSLFFVQVSGQLVPLGYAVAGFTPAAYRRRRLRRPLSEV